MIRIKVSEGQLLNEIRARSSTWLDRAKATMRHNKAVGKYETESPNWSEIKGAYICLQDSRCAYCERRLTSEEEGGNEWDVEHFRPKSSVSAWPTPSIKEERQIDYDLPNSKKSAKGYYLLSHHPFNYLVSCKSCNSRLKGNYFPVKNAPRQLVDDDPRIMTSEEALLVYPLGDLDKDPEELIDFIGVLPRIIGKTEDDKLRGRVTIDFFDLNGRQTLILQRASIIARIAFALDVLESPKSPRQKRRAQATIDSILNGYHPHKNCAKSFMRLYNADRQRANLIADRALAIEARDTGA